MRGKVDWDDGAVLRRVGCAIVLGRTGWAAVLKQFSYRNLSQALSCPAQGGCDFCEPGGLDQRVADCRTRWRSSQRDGIGRRQ